MSREEIDANEKEAYLAWRRSVAAIEEGQSQVRVGCSTVFYSAVFRLLDENV